MPDAISLPNAPIGGIYDSAANACVAAPGSPSPALASAGPTAAPEPVAITAGAQHLIDGYGQTARSSSADSLASRCEIEALRAVATCGQFVATALASTPSVLGAAVAGLVGGMACGLATAEAYDCYTKQSD